MDRNLTKHKKCIIFGNGQIAEVAHYFLKHDSDYQVVAFTVDADYCTQEHFHDLPLQTA